MNTTTETRTLSAYELAGMAGCPSPDSLTSPGARFLDGIAAHVLESRDEGEDAAAYIADAAVPVYTCDIWATFTDLAAWQEDLSELGDDGRDLTKSASLALYVIAERLASVLIEANR